ncbi:MAG TPA: S8 family serine peptidase [Solirubrobacterales bacterium]|nr:S8 family serine peptidase [Solirubrobacterales bacterium]
MADAWKGVEEWIFGPLGRQRFTQESPVLPSVWLRYAEEPSQPQDLLLTPHERSSAADLIKALAPLELEGEKVGLAYNEGYAVARLSLRDLVSKVVPLSAWWARVGARESWPADLGGVLSRLESRPRGRVAPGEGPLAWYLVLVGRLIAAEAGEADERDSKASRHRHLEVGADLCAPAADDQRGTPLWQVSLNRQARTALSCSRLTVKADAAERVFALGCSKLRWAILDTGIDATHPAFRHRRDGTIVELPEKGQPGDASRVVYSYDFTKLRAIVAGEEPGISAEDGEEIQHRIKHGRALDWDTLGPLLRIPHAKEKERGYEAPKREHGTHVAGIVGADWRLTDEGMPALTDLIGICPDIQLYDLRVFDEEGGSEEYAICGAMQFIRHLNAHSDTQVVNGANLSLSLDADLQNYAIGRTPICDEAERLTASGVVVTVAAGNEGQATFRGEDGDRDGFRTVAITDPGNAEEVITVGSTHRQNPHTYGVSYFSSRGPTGDGRAKPDLVAPGEKVESPIPGGGFQAKDGTSQAAAHAAGVAALLVARNPELIGQPRRIKQILCSTATDLGRERYFQGAGLIDALRALQEV